MAVGRIPQILYREGTGTQTAYRAERKLGSKLTRRRISELDVSTPEKIQRALQDIVSDIDTATLPSRSLPFGEGNLVIGQAFTSGADVEVKHELGRAFRGWMLLRQRALTAGTATAWEQDNASTPADREVLDKDRVKLRAAGTFTADVWVW